MKGILPVVVGALVTMTSGVRAQDFYPLEARNTWSYRVFYNNYPLPMDSVTTQLAVVGDTVMPNGRTYTRLAHPDVLGATFVRVDSNYVYYFSRYNGIDVPMYNLRGLPGTVDTIAGWMPLIWSRIAAITTRQIFGRERTIRHYFFDGLVQYEVSLADGFGIVDALDKADGIWPFFAWWSIRGCIIRDTLYGTLVSVPDNLVLPTEFSLYQNHPNPFNPKTSFRFEVSSFELVTLKVYDVHGREVATLVNETKEPGTYEVEWDASGQASGVYFYRLSAGGFTQTRKAMLVR